MLASNRGFGITTRAASRDLRDLPPKMANLSSSLDDLEQTDLTPIPVVGHPIRPVRADLGSATSNRCPRLTDVNGRGGPEINGEQYVWTV